MFDTIPRFKKNENKQILFIRILWNWQDVSVLKKNHINIKYKDDVRNCFVWSVKANHSCNRMRHSNFTICETSLSTIILSHYFVYYAVAALCKSSRNSNPIWFISKGHWFDVFGLRLQHSNSYIMILISFFLYIR